MAYCMDNSRIKKCVPMYLVCYYGEKNYVLYVQVRWNSTTLIAWKEVVDT